jgi:integrase
MRLGPGRHHDGSGLYLLVTRRLSRSWVFRFRKDGKLHDYGLGPVDVVDIATARRKAHAKRGELYEGKTPLTRRETQRIERERAEREITFAAAAERYIAEKLALEKPGQAGQWRQSLRDHALPTLGTLPVTEIGTPQVLDVLQPIWQTKTETASRVRGRIEQVLSWAQAAAFIPLGTPNPARWKDSLEHLLPEPRAIAEREHHAALPVEEIPAFMAALRELSGVDARALEFAILNASRTEEVLGAIPADELDRSAAVWNIPGARVKNFKADETHRVPLAAPALAIVDEMLAQHSERYLFPGRPGRPLGPQALRRVLEKLGRSDVTPHGFRASFRTWAGTTKHARETAELAIAHRVFGKTEAAYERGDHFAKRRALMDDWAHYCSGGAEIVPLSRREA